MLTQNPCAARRLTVHLTRLNGLQRLLLFSCLYSCTMSQSFNNIRLFLTKFLSFNLEAFLRCLFCDKNGLTKYWTKYTSPASMPFVIDYVLIDASIHTILEFQVDPLIFDEFMFIWSWTRIRSDISRLKMMPWKIERTTLLPLGCPSQFTMCYSDC